MKYSPLSYLVSYRIPSHLFCIVQYCTMLCHNIQPLRRHSFLGNKDFRGDTTYVDIRSAVEIFCAHEEFVNTVHYDNPECHAASKYDR